jgi:hypothetical protein
MTAGVHRSFIAMFDRIPLYLSEKEKVVPMSPISHQRHGDKNPAWFKICEKSVSSSGGGAPVFGGGYCDAGPGSKKFHHFEEAG